MSFLLDTHVLLWVIGDSKQLSKKVSGIIQDQNNQILLNSISLWVISLKYKFVDASYYHKLKEEFHREPYDRMLIWQSIPNKLTLISNDSEMKHYKISELKTIWH
ncbi:type II toxin-antitoxin system VapC family toxin [Leptospira selangorensis]|uniref:Type II toxin-antitoxin system VapC family toxin n=1 Tax=Leptospira selangorensis TaxID=2484982 RepID=A0ABY2NI95_9LEPT|nr:type II toxin-antitoxin system VapC family toxin [Leptospira selangorensis]TGM30458.1 type II toxin-antitoxin system VapC family toxin [Leptospira selangorensis]